MKALHNNYDPLWHKCLSSRTRVKDKAEEARSL